MNGSQPSYVKRDIKGLEEMKLFAQEMLVLFHQDGVLLKNPTGYGQAIVVGLSGDLGSGKTTFSQFVAAELGIKESVTSPTFVIEKIYETKDAGRFEHFVHIDAYRLESGKEIDVLGFKKLLQSPNTLVFVEWPERIIDALPKDIHNIQFTFIDEDTRTVMLSS